LGSSRFRGSGNADSSGTYGHFKDVNGRRTTGSARLGSSVALELSPNPVVRSEVEIQVENPLSSLASRLSFKLIAGLFK